MLHRQRRRSTTSGWISRGEFPPARPPRDMPTTGEIVRATGFCSMCDFKFRDEVVARYPAPSMPGGWAYIELRHLTAEALGCLAPLRTATSVAAHRTGRTS